MRDSLHQIVMYAIGYWETVVAWPTILIEVFSQVFDENRVFLRSFLCNQCFQGLPEERLVPRLSSAN